MEREVTNDGKDLNVEVHLKNTEYSEFFGQHIVELISGKYINIRFSLKNILTDGITLDISNNKVENVDFQNVAKRLAWICEDLDLTSLKFDGMDSVGLSNECLTDILDKELGNIGISYLIV